MSHTLDRLTIEGYKSIRKLEDFELRSLNVLIGANGAGKSNFVGFFRLLHELIEERLQLAVATLEGGADACLHLGPKVTKRIVVKLNFGRNAYNIALNIQTDGTDRILSESIVAWCTVMNTTFGESLLMAVIAGIILFAAVREVVLFARWVGALRKIRTED